MSSGYNNYGLPLQPFRAYPVWKKEVTSYESHRKINDSKYEISDHLGNVRVVVSDTRTWDNTVGTDPDASEYLERLVTVEAWSDYYPFGALMPGRHGNSESYRLGYQGSEKDDEIKGGGNSYTTEFRQYDPRLGRWLSTDPLAAKFAWASPYSGMGNNPLRNIDPDGQAPKDRLRRKLKRLDKKLDKAGITGVAQRALLTDMFLRQSRIGRRTQNFNPTVDGSQNRGGSNRPGASSTTGVQGDIASSSNIPPLAITTVFQGNLAIPVNPALVPGQVGAVAQFLTANGFSIRIVGVTSTPRTGIFQGTIRLGRQRAQFIAGALVARGVNPNQIRSTRGSLPGSNIIPGLAPTAAANRRVLIVLPSARSVIRNTRRNLTSAQRRQFGQAARLRSRIQKKRK